MKPKDNNLDTQQTGGRISYLTQAEQDILDLVEQLKLQGALPEYWGNKSANYHVQEQPYKH